MNCPRHTEDDHPHPSQRNGGCSTIIEDREISWNRQHPSRTGPGRWRGCNHRSHDNLQQDLADRRMANPMDPLPKKGNLQQCQIYRTISLISHQGLRQGLACSFVGNHEEVSSAPTLSGHPNLYDKATSAVFNSSIGDWFRTTVEVRKGCLSHPPSLTYFWKGS